jgi:hypothetical protein
MPERDPLRVMDAKLHSALYGIPVKWHVCVLDKGVVSDFETFFENEPRMAMYHKLADELEQGYSRQPCAKTDSSIYWQVIPHYSTDIAAAWKAEGDLPEAVRVDYLYCITNIAVRTPEGERPVPAGWLRRRATPAQMVAAMLEALGVGDGQ